jgi:hypothetical protein
MFSVSEETGTATARPVCSLLAWKQEQRPLDQYVLLAWKQEQRPLDQYVLLARKQEQDQTKSNKAVSRLAEETFQGPENKNYCLVFNTVSCFNNFQLRDCV